MVADLSEELPAGAVPCVDAPWGSRVAYVDLRLGIRFAEVGQSGRMPFGFLVPAVERDTERLLRGRLLAELPGADELRTLRSGGRFFMCAVRLP